jgi:hypothetical protein
MEELNAVIHLICDLFIILAHEINSEVGKSTSLVRVFGKSDIARGGEGSGGEDPLVGGEALLESFAQHLYLMTLDIILFLQPHI